MSATRKQILLAEDDPNDVLLLRRAFRGVALPLLDLKHPRRWGFEVLEWVRRHAGMSKLPVVVLTSSRQPADIDRAYELRANSYLVKPATLEGLREMVHALELYRLRMNEGPAVAR